MKLILKFTLVCLLTFSAKSQLTWYPSSTGLPIGYLPVQLCMTSNYNVFALCQRNLSNSITTKLLKSINNGSTWSEVNTSGLPSLGPTSILSVGNTLFLTAILSTTANSVYELYTSTDFGANWSKLTTGLPASYEFYRLAKDNAGNIYLAGMKPSGPTNAIAFVAQSTDGGASFTDVSGTQLNSVNSVYGFGFAGNKLLIHLAGNGATNFLLESSDGGSTWISGGAGLSSSFRGSDFCTASTGEIYVVGATNTGTTTSITLFSSTDNTATWNQVAMTGASAYVAAFSILQTNGPLLICGPGLATGSQPANTISNFILSNQLTTGLENYTKSSNQIFPNPMQGNTLHLAKGDSNRSLFLVRVFSQDGRLILSVDDPTNTIEVGQLQTGFYYIELIGEETTETFKLIKE